MRIILQRFFIVVIVLMSLSSTMCAQEFFAKKDLMSVGVYYYPEHWSPDQWERDIKNIADHGFKFIHMAEFAWAQMEHKEGEFDFRWLDEVVDLAAKYNLKVILGTPTPCPPVWLGLKHPEIYIKDANCQSKEHGTRANLSLSNPVVLTYTKKIVEAMAKHYGDNKAVMGWQIDNEPEAKEDYSEASQSAFRNWLKEKYKTIDSLNVAWGTPFWSQLYASFNEVRIHNATNVGWWGANPIALLDFKRYTADTQAAFLDYQAEILRNHIYKNQFITTNYVAKGNQADPKRSHKMDFASFTAYPNYGSHNLGELGFRLGNHTVLMYANDYYKSVGGITGVMELQPGQVNWANHNSLLLPGAVRMWLWHCFAGGSSFACTYRYRQILYGAEQYHHGIVGTDGVTLGQGGKEYVQVIQEIEQLKKVYDSKVNMPEEIQKRSTAILWSFDNMWNLERQKQTYQWNTWVHMQRYQEILHSFGAPVTFIDEEDDFSKYNYIVAPAYEMVDEVLVQKWNDYVKQGGNLVLSVRTGAKDKNAHLWESNSSGAINNLIGGKVQTFDMLPSDKVGQVLMNGKQYEWSCWAEQIVPDANTVVLAKHDDQFYKGATCVLKHQIGKGTVWYLGVESRDGCLEKELFKSIFEENIVSIEDYPQGVFVQYRDGFMVAVNYSSEEYQLPVNANYIIGNSVLPPAGVSVWSAR